MKKNHGVRIINPLNELASVLTEFLAKYTASLQRDDDINRLLSYCVLRFKGSCVRIIEDKDDWNHYFQMEWDKLSGGISMRMDLSASLEDLIAEIEKKVHEAFN